MSDLAWLVAKPIAHRGLHDKAAGVIENTLSAASRAIERGLPIECDLQLTTDGEAVVFHDFALDRLTGESGEVRARSAAALARIGITGSPSDTIPTLSGFLTHVAGKVPLVIEIKSRFDGDTTLTRRACAVLAEYSGPYVIKSFDPDVVTELRWNSPAIPRGIIGEVSYSHSSYSALPAERKHALANLLHYDQSRFQFVSWNVRDLPAAGPYLSRALAGMPVMAWTVRNTVERTRAERHADQIVFEGFIP